MALREDELSRINVFDLHNKKPYTWDDFYYMFDRERETGDFMISALIAVKLMGPSILREAHQMGNSPLENKIDDQDMDDVVVETYLTFRAALKNFDPEKSGPRAIAAYLRPSVKDSINKVKLDAHTQYQIDHGLWQRDVLWGEKLAWDKQYMKRDTINSETYKDPVDLVGYRVIPTEQTVFSLVEQKRRVILDIYLESFVPKLSEKSPLNYKIAYNGDQILERNYNVGHFFKGMANRETVLTFIQDLNHWSEEKIDETLKLLLVNPENVQNYAGYDFETILNKTKHSPGIIENISEADRIYNIDTYAKAHNLKPRAISKYINIKDPLRSVTEDNMLADIEANSKAVFPDMMKSCIEHHYPPCIIEDYYRRHELPFTTKQKAVIDEAMDHYGDYKLFFTESIQETFQAVNDQIKELLLNKYFEDIQLKYIICKGDFDMSYADLSTNEQLEAISKERQELSKNLSDLNDNFAQIQNALKTMQTASTQINMRLSMLDEMEARIRKEQAKTADKDKVYQTKQDLPLAAAETDAPAVEAEASEAAKE